MKALVGLVAGALLVALAATALAESRGLVGAAGAVFGGMMGPLAAVAASWIVVVRTHRRSPGEVTRVMLAAFMAKALFFAAYVVAMIKVVGLEPLPFMISFAAFFVGLYVVQAAMLARLFRRTQDVR
jgi:predicted transporter